MSIILRTNKGQALTYDEMDRNLSQFYYSSSVAPDGTKIRLHFSGSDNLDLATEDYGPTRYHEIQFPSTDITIPEAIAAGNNTQIQFNDNGAFGADSVFVFEKVKNYLGVATSNPTDRLDIHGDGQKGASISLRGQSSGVGEFGHAKLNFFDGSTFLGRIGRTDTDNENIYITNNHQPTPLLNAYSNIHISIGDANNGDDNNVVGTFKRSNNISYFGVGTKSPNRVGTFVGANGIGISLSSANTDQSILTPIPSSIYNSISNGLHDLIPNNSDASGLLIATPGDANGGNVVVAINTDTTNKNEGFNIINAFGGSYSNSEVIFSAQASGKVGINTNFPSDTGLTVAGNISGSGTLQVETIATGTANNTSALVATSTGLVQKIAAAPVPVGGIIMWSGTIANIPSGWALCNGSNGTPNLQDRFVVGAKADGEGSAYPGLQGGATGGSADAVVVEHNHGGNTQNAGSHQHRYVDAYFAEVGGSPNRSVAGSDEGFDNDNEFFYRTAANGSSRNEPTENQNPLTYAAGTHQHPINSAGVSGTNKNLPPYYALAFIMYIGV